jgi:small subunit ribosomal protein S9
MSKSGTEVKKTKEINPAADATPIVLKVPAENKYGTGRRKTSIAKVWVFKGKGEIAINRHSIKYYLKRDILVDIAKRPLDKLQLDKKYDIRISVQGGGLTGQAYAIQLGIARALLNMDENFRKPLRDEGLLTRDARIKERKKYGRKKARKGYQFRKR